MMLMCRYLAEAAVNGTSFCAWHWAGKWKPWCMGAKQAPWCPADHVDRYQSTRDLAIARLRVVNQSCLWHRYAQPSCMPHASDQLRHECESGSAA